MLQAKSDFIDPILNEVKIITIATSQEKNGFEKGTDWVFSGAGGS